MIAIMVAIGLIIIIIIAGKLFILEILILGMKKKFYRPFSKVFINIIVVGKSFAEME